MLYKGGETPVPGDYVLWIAWDGEFEGITVGVLSFGTSRIRVMLNVPYIPSPRVNAGRGILYATTRPNPKPQRFIERAASSFILLYPAPP